MLFKRRNPENTMSWLRVLVWPRRSWGRSGQYVAKRIMRLTASPHAVSAGVAAGVFTSFTPFLGLHFVVAFLIAYILAGNFLAAALGTFFGNPISFPFIWAATYHTGSFILGTDQTVPLDETLSSLIAFSIIEEGLYAFWLELVSLWDTLIKPMLIGSLPLGIAFAVPAYLLTRRATNMFRIMRQRKIHASKAVPVDQA